MSAETTSRQNPSSRQWAAGRQSRRRRNAVRASSRARLPGAAPSRQGSSWTSTARVRRRSGRAGSSRAARVRSAPRAPSTWERSSERASGVRERRPTCRARSCSGGPARIPNARVQAGPPRGRAPPPRAPGTSSAGRLPRRPPALLRAAPARDRPERAAEAAEPDAAAAARPRGEADARAEAVPRARRRGRRGSPRRSRRGRAAPSPGPRGAATAAAARSRPRARGAEAFAASAAGGLRRSCGSQGHGAPARAGRISRAQGDVAPSWPFDACRQAGFGARDLDCARGAAPGFCLAEMRRDLAGADVPVERGSYAKTRAVERRAELSN